MEDIKLTCVGCKKEFLFPVHEQKFFEKNGFTPPKRCRACRSKRRQEKAQKEEVREEAGGDKNWSGKCIVCGGTPTVPDTGMCGPCTFGEADTAGGNW